MAIIKDFQTHFGITSNYHRLLKVEIRSEERVVEMVVGVYVSESARDGGGSPLWHEYVRVPFEQLNFDPRDIFYPLLQDYNMSYLQGGTTDVGSGVTPHPPVFEVSDYIPPPPPPPPTVPFPEPVPLPPAPSPPVPGT
jgi:hypothetical protein